MVANLTTRLGQLTSSPAGGPYVGKNRIINGNAAIDQRNGGASFVASNGNYGLDRFFYGVSQASKITCGQNYLSVAPPAGAAFYFGMQTSTAFTVGAGDVFYMAQTIEGLNTADLGFGTANAKSVTLSFLAYSSLTGTFGGSLRNATGARSYPFTYSIPVANTWTTISITIPGDTSGTWSTGTAGSLLLSFSYGTGTTYSGTAGSWSGSNYVSATGAVSVVGTLNATLHLTNVQLEAGTIATPYEFNQYQVQLLQCYRYFQSYSYATNTAVASANAYGTVNTFGTSTIQAPMRTAPTGGYTGSLVYFSNLVAYTCSTILFSNTTGNTWEINTVVAGAVGGSGGWWRTNGASTLTLSAEL